MKFLRRATGSGLQDKHRVLNSDPSIWMKVSEGPQIQGSDCEECSERSSIFCVTYNKGAMAEGAMHFITDGRSSAATARCPLLGQDI